MANDIKYSNKQGIACSVFPFGHSRHMFLAGEPETLYINFGDVPGQIRNLLENVNKTCQEQGFLEKTACICHIFLEDIGLRELVRQWAMEICPNIFRAVTFVPQAPASGAAVAIEIWAITSESPDFLCESDDDDYLNPDEENPTRRHFVVAEFDEMRWCFCGGASPENSPAAKAYERSLCAFNRLEEILADGGFSLDQLLRTWIYQGYLVLPEGETQRYKELNRARTDFFTDTPFLQNNLPEDYDGVIYPASTGIGADDFDVVISAIAFDSVREDVIVIPLENPNQTSAFEYGEEYSPQSPKFSRATAVATEDTCLIFVSGTASITDSESQHPDDVAKQTEQTLDNIAGLVADGNLTGHGIKGFASGLGNLESVRVYAKRREDLEAIREVCNRRLPNVPTIYTIADVCRPELLVEIEGVVVAKKQQ